MSGFYDGVSGRRTYRFPAATISSAAVVGRFIGPAGKVGRVVGFEYLVTTGITVANGTVVVDTNAGLTGPFTATAEIASANAGGAATAAELKAGAELPADTTIEVQAGGEPTAGAADLIVTVAWY